jgi:hypothetical protein
MNARARRPGLRGLAAAALLLAVAAAESASAQTVRVADLQPRQRQVFTRPAQPLRLSVNLTALQGYGGVTGVRFRLVSEGMAEFRSTTGACMAVPTRILSPRLTSTGELDFGSVFSLGDLNVERGRLAETRFYLVAEVAGLTGDDLFMRQADLKRYVVRGVRLVVRAPTGPTSPAQIKKIESRPEPHAKPSSAQCWTVG